VALIRKAAIDGDRADGHLAADKQLPGAIDPLHQQPSMRRQTRSRPESPDEVAARKPAIQFTIRQAVEVGTWI